MAITTYPLSAFTVSGGKVNGLTLKRAMSEAGLSVVCTGIGPFDTGCSVETDGDPTAGDLTLMSGVVAAHTGEWFAPAYKLEVSEGEEDDDTGDEIVKVTLTTGLMQAGVYQIGWYMELAQTTQSTTSGARGRLMVKKNGGSAVERSQQNVDINQWQIMSGSLSIDAEDGDEYTFELTYERIGASGNAARARFARITWARHSGI